MNNDPKVSVIMGVYNCGDSAKLEYSVKSVLSQNYKNLELIICNDGSTDDTLQRLHKIQKLDNRIKIISYEKNMGLAFALNNCLKHSEGEYIARQDDDDISYPDRISTQIMYLEKNKDIDFVGSNADIFNENGIWGIYRVPENPTVNSFLWGNPFAHPTVVFRKRCLEDLKGYRVSKETRRSEDYDLFMRLYSAGYKGVNIQDCLYKYYIENGNTNRRPMRDRIDEAIVRFKGYYDLGIIFHGIPYVLKPIMVGLIPRKYYLKINARKYKK